MAARDQGSADGADKPGLPEVSGRPGSIAGRGRLVGGGAAAAPFRPTGPGSLSPAGRGSSGVPLDTGVPVVPVGRRQVVPGAAPVEQPARWCRTGRPGCCDVGTAAGYAASTCAGRGVASRSTDIAAAWPAGPTPSSRLLHRRGAGDYLPPTDRDNRHAGIEGHARTTPPCGRERTRPGGPERSGRPG